MTAMMLGVTAYGQNTFKYPIIIGTNGGVGGQLTLRGETSGAAVIRVPAVAGTGTIFQIPATNGTSGYVLSTNGSGVLTWVEQTGGSNMTYPPVGIPTSTGAAWAGSITNNSANWNTAYGWGDHGVEGYATRQNINDTADVYLSNATVGIGRVDSTGWGSGNYMPRAQTSALITSMAPADNGVKGIQAAGSPIKALTLGQTAPATAGYISLVDSTIYYELFYLPKAITITGVRLAIGNATGNFTISPTADNMIGIYSVSDGTLTRVAMSADNDNLWKGSTYTALNVPLTSSYSASAGLYAVALIYNGKTVTADPALFYTMGISSLSVDLYALPNALKISGTSRGATLPASIASTGITAYTYMHYIAIY